MERRRLIDQRELGARALQEGFCNKKAKPEPKQGGFVGIRTARSRPAMSDVRGAEAIDHFRGKARAIVADGDADLISSPARRDLDPTVGEIDRVLDQIA